MRSLRLTALVLLGLALPVGLRSHSGQVDPQRGCNLYQSGVRSVDENKFKDAIENFDYVVNSCPQPNIKAQALIQKGFVYLKMWPRQFGDARKVVDRVIKEFFGTPSGPEAYLLAGMIELEETRNFEGARDQFKKVGDIAPSTSAFAESLYLAAETRRLAHQPLEALKEFRDVTLRYPRMPLTAKALLGSAECYVRLGEIILAMEALQRVRREFPNTPEALQALRRNTILHRILMRGPAQSAQAGRVLGAGRFRDAVGLALDGIGNVVVGYRDGAAVLAPENGQQVLALGMGPAVVGASAVGLGPGGIVALARERFVSFANGAPDIVPGLPQKDGTSEMLEIQAFVTNWRGEWLIADGKTSAIHRFSADGTRHLGVFAANIKALRMITNGLDDIAVVNERTKGIDFYLPNGAPLGQIPRRGVGYEWEAPTDIAFDTFGNLYVLAGDKGSIHVFDSARTFRTTIQLPLKGPPQIRKAVALAIDGSGRIYVLDRDGQQVLAFQ